MTDRWRTDPTTVLLVCNGVTRHQEPTMGTVMRPGDRSLLSRSELQQGGWPCLPVRMAWWILCRTTAVTVGASATTWMTMLLALGMALLESISYTPGLSAGRTSEELRGAQGSGQTAWFHTSRGSTLTRVLWTGGRESREPSQTGNIVFAPVFQRYLSQSKWWCSTILLLLFLTIKICCS